MTYGTNSLQYLTVVHIARTPMPLPDGLYQTVLNNVLHEASAESRAALAGRNRNPALTSLPAYPKEDAAAIAIQRRWRGHRVRRYHQVAMKPPRRADADWRARAVSYPRLFETVPKRAFDRAIRDNAGWDPETPWLLWFEVIQHKLSPEERDAVWQSMPDDIRRAMNISGSIAQIRRVQARQGGRVVGGLLGMAMAAPAIVPLALAGSGLVVGAVAGVFASAVPLALCPPLGLAMLTGAGTSAVAGLGAIGASAGILREAGIAGEAVGATSAVFVRDTALAGLRWSVTHI